MTFAFLALGHIARAHACLTPLSRHVSSIGDLGHGSRRSGRSHGGRKNRASLLQFVAVCCNGVWWQDMMQPSCAQHLRISQELNDDATQLMPEPKQNSLAFSGTTRLSNKHPHPTHEATAHDV